jgi:membrane-bound serine protease (ClpP class)
MTSTRPASVYHPSSPSSRGTTELGGERSGANGYATRRRGFEPLRRGAARGARGLLAILGASTVVIAGLALASAAPAGATAPRVLAIRFGPDLEVNPVTQSYLNHELDEAARHYDAAVIELDTPGGLSASLRAIYQKELALKVPVIVYVSPSGARAASAGVWIAEAGDVLALSPVSNIGSSTPIDSSGANISSDLRRKVINDAAASLRALAATHERNTAWPVLAVTKASNLTAQQALRMHVIDTIAPTLPQLLRQLEGYRTKDTQRPFTLHLAGAEITTVSPGLFTRFLNTLIDPNLISILFLVGIVGLVFELFHPGAVLPGAVGAVSLSIALFGFAILPLSWAGLALVVLGAALLVIDLHAVTHGVLTVAGLICLGVGLPLLYRNAPPPYHVNTGLVVGLGLAIASFWVFATSKGIAARRAPVQMGPQTLVGSRGEMHSDAFAFVNGELWHAHSSDGSQLRPGDPIEIDAVDGLELAVTPIRDRTTAAQPINAAPTERT